MDSSFSASRKVAWVVWVIASVFYAYQYILRVMPSIMLDDIMSQFGINAAILGQFSGLYYVGYSLLHLPVGIMLDRYGPRNVMTGCILLTVVGMLPLVFADHFMYPMAGRFLIGVGSSAAILGVFKIVRMVFSEKRFPRMLSFSVTIGLIGAIYGGGPVSYMRELLGYGAVVKIFSLSGVALAIITYWTIPKLESSSKGSVISNVKEVLGNKKVILSCLFAGLMVGPLEGFADVWGTSFLKQVYGFDAALAASLPSLIFMGMCFGSPMLSFIAEKVGSYLGVVIGSGILMMLGFVFLLSFSLSSGLVSLNFILIGICCAYQVLSVYKASTYVRGEVAGLTTAVANMIIMTFGYVFHAAMGSIIAFMGGIAAPYAFFLAISVIPLALFIGAAGFFWLLIQERKENKVIA
jgi:predicted MFS family arabinose efflux permease